MMMPQQYCLRWKHHHTNVQNMFAQLLEKERFCDVTLYCSPSFATQVPNKDTVEPQNIRGVSLRAHRVVLAACSELLGALLGAHEAQGEPVLVIDGAEPRHLRALLDYMYTGEMNVHHSQLASLLKTAEELRIKGLTDIRWNNKDEPPDCEAGIITTTHTEAKPPEKHTEAKHPPKHASPKYTSPKHMSPKRTPEPEQEPRPLRIEDSDNEGRQEKFNVNGGPPPLIKLPLKEKCSPVKRENSDSDSPSPKRQRLTSGTEHTDDDSVSVTKSERDQEWQHGNLVSDISAERVVGWGMPAAAAAAAAAARGSWSRDASDDEWADAPADIGSFLHTRLRVDGDNSADEESEDSGAGSASRPSASASALDLQAELAKTQLASYSRPTVGPKSGPTDSRFTDVVKLSDYLQHGRRPQFWEENYVKRVMEAVRLKELEMKQAAEILGVSYGTLYGRYRDVYGCINRPYSSVGGRAVREYWQAAAPREVLERLQRGELALDAAARALGVSVANLAAHVADFGVPEKDFEPIPIEIDPSLKPRARTFSATAAPTKPRKGTQQDKPIKKIMVGSITDEDPIPATIISTHDVKPAPAGAATTTVGAAATANFQEMSSCKDLDSAHELHLLKHNLTLCIAQNKETVREQKTAKVISEDLHVLDKGIAHVITNSKLGPELNKSTNDINSVSADTDYDITVNYDPLELSISNGYYNLDAPKVFEKQDLSIKDSGPSSLIQESNLSSKEIFDEKSNWTSHLRTHSSLPLERFTEKCQVTNNSNDHNDKVEYVCNVCTESFDEKSVYTKHTESHCFSLRPYICVICQKKFTRHSSLIQHARSHTRLRSYVCNICNRVCTRKDGLQKHMATKHSDDKPCVCDVCNKSFCREDNLLRHKRTHNTVKPYVCHVCNNRFARKDYLTQHYRRVHVRSRVKKSRK